MRQLDCRILVESRQSATDVVGAIPDGMQLTRLADSGLTASGKPRGEARRCIFTPALTIRPS